MIPFAVTFFISHYLGKLAEKRGVPGLLPMLLLGMALGEGLSLATGQRWTAGVGGSPLHLGLGQAEFLKELALVVILLRAGLGIPLGDLKGLKRVGLMLSSLPMLMEMSMVALSCWALLGWSWRDGLLLGAVLASVSPAVIVPRMLRLREHPKVNRSVPTLILLGASFDDVLALFIFGSLIAFGLEGGNAGSWMLEKGVVSVVLGLGIGWSLGWAISKPVKVFGEKSGLEGWLVSLLLVAIAMTTKHLIEGQGWPIHPLLLIMAMALSLLHFCTSICNMAGRLKLFWDWAQIPLFVIIGMQLELSALSGMIGLGILILALGLLARGLGVLLSLLGTGWESRVRLYTVMAYLPKATVQAAIGAIVFELHQKGHTSFSAEVGSFILSMAVLSILLTAPLGAWLMDRKVHWLYCEEENQIR